MPSPSPAPSPSVGATSAPSPSASATPAQALITGIPTARLASIGTRLTVRGVVTLPPGVVDAETAIIQDAGGAIVLRVDGASHPMDEGDLVEVDGVRSTKGGMDTLRLVSPVRPLGSGNASALAVTASEVTEALEARLVMVRGTLAGSARRASSGTVSFDVVDATGVVRVVLPSTLQADDTALVAGVEVEVLGVVGQETTAAEPLLGYRIWPRRAEDVRIVASPRLEPAEGPRSTQTTGQGTPTSERSVAPPPATASHTLDLVGAVGLADLRVGATLVVGEWPELGIGGLLWDGARVVAISPQSANALASINSLRPPVPLALTGLRLTGTEPYTSVPIVTLGTEPRDVALAEGPTSAPRPTLPDAGQPPAWVSLTGRVSRGAAPVLDVGHARIALELRCDGPLPLQDGVLSVTGIGLGDPARLIVPCDGIRAAPTLSRAVEEPGAPTQPRAPAAAETRGLPQGADPRRVLAAWLLALAVLVVGGAAVAWRRLVPLQPEPEAEPVEDGGPEMEANDVPRLTLVRLRRERGS
jgi:hypothetical protein